MQETGRAEAAEPRGGATGAGTEDASHPRGMTLRQRILVSNLLMVLIPVAATALVALLCAGAIWHSLSLGQGFDGTDDLREATLAATAAADRALSETDATRRADKLATLETLLDKTGLSLEAYDSSSGALAFSHGQGEANDAELARTARALGSGGLAERGGSVATVTQLSARGDSYDLVFYGSVRQSASYPQLKASIVGAAALVLATVLASSAFASRVISRVLVRHFQDELARTSASLAESNERLRQRDLMRRQLVADISHDLRSPLTSIRGYAEGLLDGIAATPERQRHYLEVIRDKSVQVSEMAERVFAFSKLELDDYPVRHDRVSLDELARKSADQVRAEHPGQLEVTVDTGGLAALADADLLSRCLTNVLENSAKYRAGDVAHVSVTCRELGGRVIMELADDGIGVTTEDARRLFEPFFRADAARERPQDGSGLGLAFVRRALELMDGTAEATSLEPHGLLVRLALPAATKEAPWHES